MKLTGIPGKLMVLAAILMAASCNEADVLPTESEVALKGANISKGVGDRLTEGQEGILLFIFEEEKMARDVYRTLYDKWDAAVFDNIIQSEQMHKDAIEKLLVNYGIEYTDEDITGEFVNTTIQNLYDSLTASGETSLVAALNVGMFIEDFDIADLSESLAEFDQKDVTSALGNLIEGSKNHLRAFYNNQLTINPEYSYDPEFISEELYIEILAATGPGRNGR